MHSLPDSDMELYMELLKLLWMKTTQELRASYEVFYAVWNAVAHMTQNGYTDNVKFDAVKHQPTPTPYANQHGGKPRTSVKNTGPFGKGKARPCDNWTHKHASGKCNFPTKKLNMQCMQKKGHSQGTCHRGQPKQSNASGKHQRDNKHKGRMDEVLVQEET